MAIKFKGTETSGLQPTGLGERELALNLTDNIIYSVNSSAQIVEFLGTDENATWGTINGTLSDQTDLQNELTGLSNAIDLKEDDLGLPSQNGYILSSTASGTRAWIENSASGAWGTITGILSDQTDLQSALDAKEDGLNDPAFDNQVLASTNAGVRSWITVSLTDENAIWGNITGTLSNQTDLQLELTNLSDAIDLKEDDLGNPSTDGEVLVSTSAGVRTWATRSATWGSLTGTLSNQTDLQNELNAKVNLTDSIGVLSDVDVTTIVPVVDDCLHWDGNNWVPNSDLEDHITNTLNPHNVTKSQVGLGNVNNTSDVDKPISTAQQSEFNNKENSLLNPTTTGYVLSSTSAGVRSWIAQTGNTDVNAIWGNISGTLSNQTDLQDALNLKFNNTGGTVTGDIDIVSGSGAKLNIETTISGGQPQLHLTDFNGVPRGIFGADTTTGDVGLTRIDDGGTVVGTIRLDTLGNVKLLAGPSETIPIPTDDAHLVNLKYVTDEALLKEDDLGLPAGNNYVLASDTLGNRSWFDAAAIGVTSVNGETGVVTLDSDDIDEGVTNLYYTDTRADARVQFAIQDTTSSTTTLYSSSKVDSLISGSLSYKGGWNATTNTPTISNATGSNGDFYKCEVAGTQDLGSGSISFNTGDDVIHNGTVYERFGSTSAIDSVNGQTGVVVLGTDDINEGSTNLWYTDVRVDARLVNIIDDNVTVSNLTWSSTKIDTEITNATNSIVFPVTQVNGKQGNVTVTKADVQLGNCDNTSDLDKPLSNATTTALNGKSDTNHLHTGVYEPENANIQGHIAITDGSNPHSTTLTSLTDTPSSLTGFAGARVTVNGTEDGYNFESPSVNVSEAKPTGLVNGGELNIITNDIEVTAGNGIKVDSYTNPSQTPTYVELSWNTIQIAIDDLTPQAGDKVHMLLVDDNTPGPIAGTNLGVLHQFVNTAPDPSIVRDEIYLGYVIYNGTTWGEVSSPVVVNNSAVSLAEFVKTVVGPSFSQQGGAVSEATTFTLDRASGVIWELNRNWHVNKRDPHRESFNEQLGFQWRYTNRDFTTTTALTSTVDPTQYDNNGTVTNIPGSPQTSSIQRLFVDTRDNYWVLYGQNTYDNYNDAVAKIGVDETNTVKNNLLDTSLFLGYIISEKSENDWTPESARFVSAIEAIGGGSGTTPVETFLGLTDTPTDYTGNANQILQVNAGETALEFIDNVGIGEYIGSSIAISDDNTALGNQTNLTADNIAIGRNAGETITTGGGLYQGYNTLIGASSGQFISTGSGNTFIGVASGQGNVTDTVAGDENLGFGGASLQQLTTGSRNVGLGLFAGSLITTGSNNLCIGNRSGQDLTTQNNQLRIGIVANEDLILGDFATKKVQIDGELTADVVTFDSLFDYGTIGGTFTLDYINGQYQKVTLNSSGTMVITPPSGNKPCTFYLHIHQDATGGRVLTLPTGKWINGISKPNTTTANAHDLLMVHYYGGTNYVYEIMLNLS